MFFLSYISSLMPAKAAEKSRKHFIKGAVEKLH
jgi:hypothetical protein